MLRNDITLKWWKREKFEICEKGQKMLQKSKNLQNVENIKKKNILKNWILLQHLKKIEVTKRRKNQKVLQKSKNIVKAEKCWDILEKLKNSSKVKWYFQKNFYKWCGGTMSINKVYIHCL